MKAALSTGHRILADVIVAASDCQGRSLEELRHDSIFYHKREAGCSAGELSLLVRVVTRTCLVSGNGRRLPVSSLSMATAE
jgi:hypothetical protein